MIRRPPRSTLFPYTSSSDLDGREAAAVPANRAANADLGFDQAVVAAFAGPMKEQDDGPLFLLCPIVRNEDLILVLGARDGYRAIEKTRLDFFGFCRRNSQGHGG